MAVWEGWENPTVMQLTIDSAIERFAVAKNQWLATYGPGAAYVLTCWRLQWEVIDVARLRTDQGELLDLRFDPPAVIIQQCHLAVQRWRWRRLEKVFPHLAATGSGRGPLIEPIWKVLQPKARTADWTAQHQGGLR